MNSIGTPLLWTGFIAFVLAMLALDLGVFHRKAHTVKAREALVWTGVWIGLALVFDALIWWRFGHQHGVEFLTGYVIEKSLSVDNIFVMVVIFSSLGIPALHQHRVLFWGILSALVLRAAMIFAGTAMLARFHWLMYVFGVFLIFTGLKLFLDRDKEDDPQKSWAMRAIRRVLPSTPEFHGSRFIVRMNGRWLATPLFMALALVEVTDIIFAVDSIPAILAITHDPFIVFTSNIFAILGLRSLFFLLANMVDRFTYLKTGLSVVLVYVGVKMTIVEWVKIPSLLSLGVICLILATAVVLSLVRSKRHPEAAAHGEARG